MRSSKLVLSLALLVVCTVCVLPSGAQLAATGTLVGVVTDPSSAVVPGATVTLIDTTTKTERAATTNDSGRYVFVNIPPGSYNVAFSKPSFASAKVLNQIIKVGITTVLDTTLQIGGANVVVEVQATGTELQTTNSTVGNTISGIALDSLPSLNRDVSTFIELQPGVSPDGSVAGAVVDQSSFMLDGGNNTNDMDGSMSVYTSSFAGDPTGGISNQSFAVAGGPTGVSPRVRFRGSPDVSVNSSSPKGRRRVPAVALSPCYPRVAEAPATELPGSRVPASCLAAWGLPSGRG